MLQVLKKKLNEIYEDGSIGYDNLAKRLVCLIKQRITGDDIVVFKELKKKSREVPQTGTPVSVVFLLQMPELWGKQKSIYQEMIKHDNIKTYILAIPKYNIQKKKPDITCNEAYAYAVGEALTEVIDANVDGNWFALETLSPDYVFYQRPYEEYLPEVYRSYNVIKYAKTCYVPYAFFLATAEDMNMEYNRGFARNIYFNYVYSVEIKKLVQKRFFLSSALGLRKIEYLGIPMLESICKKKEENQGEAIWKNWGCTENQLRVLWTPRWTTNSKLGGSHFFQYKDAFIEFAERERDFFVALRPHPLAFDNYINQKQMSEEEVARLKQTYENAENMAIDTNKNYDDTFWGCDVLVTDPSSMLMEYFVTGKPIVFCGTNLKLNSLHQEVIDVLYKADNWEELENILFELRRGNDVLKEERRKVIEKRFPDTQNVSKRITESIVEDFSR